MAILRLRWDELKDLKKFEILCKTCGSNMCELEIDWAAYESCSWNNTTLICKNCNEEEVCYES